MKKYPQEVHEFIRNNVAGKTLAELVEVVNNTFDTNFTISKMKAYKENHKLKSGVAGGPKPGAPTALYPQEVMTFIAENHKGKGHKAMADLLNDTFGTSYTQSQMKSYYGNHKLNSSITGHFPKGHIPYNKGKKGCYAAGCEKSWFKKGNKPHNHVPVGTEITRADGYTWRKTGEPHTWKPKHVLLWEKNNGKVPEKHVVTFLDGNKKNIVLENLALISRSEHMYLTRYKLRSEFPEVTESAILVARIKTKRNSIKKDIEKQIKRVSGKKEYQEKEYQRKEYRYKKERENERKT